jgi:hypothetical protein
MSKEIPEWVKTTLDEIKAKLEVMDSKIDTIVKTTMATSVTSRYDTLPWKPHKKGVGEWIFANTYGAQELLEKLKAAEGKTIFDKTHRYVLSEDERFIRRYNRKLKQTNLTDISKSKE